MGPFANSILAFALVTAGVTLLRVAWRLMRADTRYYQRLYPTVRHAFLGRRAVGGRSGWLVLDRSGRLVSDVSRLR